MTLYATLAASMLLGFAALSIGGTSAAPLNAPAVQFAATSTPDLPATLPPLMPPPPATPAAPVVSAPPVPAVTSVQTIDDPARAVPIDNLPHKIEANSATWFSFFYAPQDANNNRISNTIALVNAYNSGVRFEVWTGEHMLDWWDGKKPVGQGTANNVACDSSAGPCQSTDLTWAGTFNTGGIYFVRVVNGNSNPVIFQLTIN
jgi:hypothetical protein